MAKKKVSKTKAVCVNCKFYKKETCCRYPESIIKNKGEWCGEFAKK